MTSVAVEMLAAWRDADVTISLLRRDRRLTPGRLTAVIAFFGSRAPRLDDLR